MMKFWFDSPGCDLQDAEELIQSHIKRQGTTSVVPKSSKKNTGFSPCGKGWISMRKWLEICGLFAIFLLPEGLKGQLLCIDTRDGRSREGDCTCEGEKVTSNLTIANPVKLTGSLSDATGAPIQFSGTTIQVRDPLGAKSFSLPYSTSKGDLTLALSPPVVIAWSPSEEKGRKLVACQHSTSLNPSIVRVRMSANSKLS
jgi:hypothetical protein